MKNALFFIVSIYTQCVKNKFYALFAMVFLIANSSQAITHSAKQKTDLSLQQIFKQDYKLVVNTQMIPYLLSTKQQDINQEFESISINIQSAGTTQDCRYYLVNEKILRKLGDIQAYHQNLLDKFSEKDAQNNEVVQFARNEINKICAQFFSMMIPLREGELQSLQLSPGNYQIIALKIVDGEHSYVKKYPFEIVSSFEQQQVLGLITHTAHLGLALK